MADDPLTHPLARLLDDELLSLLARRELAVPRPAHGRRHGPHRSIRAGIGRDFRDHRPYVPGDDLRQLDWRAAARQPRLMVRRTEAEEERAMVLVVDAGAGMAYGGDPTAGPSHAPSGTPQHKWRRAATLACALTQVASRQGDPTALLVGAAGAVRDNLSTPRAGRHRARAVAELLWDARAAGRCPWTALLGDLDRQLRPRSSVLVFSDLLDMSQGPDEDPDEAEAAVVATLADLRARGHDITMVQILHRDELDFPWRDRRVARFEDLRELRAPVEAPAGDLRTSYLQRIAAHLDRQVRTFERQGLRLVRTVTDTSPSAAVLELLERLGGAPARGLEEAARP